MLLWKKPRSRGGPCVAALQMFSQSAKKPIKKETNIMTPGPDYIYKCPKCSNLLRRGSLRSGNTIGAELYSDGKQIAPMLPEFPNLTKCKKCETILWLSEMKEIGTCDLWDDESNEKSKKEWQNADRAEFLDVDDWFRAFELDGVKKDREKEKIVRCYIWRAFNDRIRLGTTDCANSDFVLESEEVSWKQNCLRLIELLDKKDINQKIMTAELHRNLGEFELCMEIINSLDSDYAWLIERFKIECENKNKLLVKLN